MAILRLSDLVRGFCPNERVPGSARLIFWGGWAAIFFTLWVFGAPKLVPRPLPVLDAFVNMALSGALLEGLLSSIETNAKAIFFATLLTLPISYLTVLAVMEPVATVVTKARFLGLTGLTFLFTILIGGGTTLKVTLVTFGITVFFVSSVVSIVMSIPKDEFDHARSLGMKEWKVVWHVVVIGRLDQVVEQMSINAAIGWVMLTMVEGLVRSDGGLGAMLLNDNKQFKIENIFAIQFTIMMVGLGMDYAFRWGHRLAFPYAHLTLERK